MVSIKSNHHRTTTFLIHMKNNLICICRKYVLNSLNRKGRLIVFNGLQVPEDNQDSSSPKKKGKC